jgi:hypothetical protein
VGKRRHEKITSFRVQPLSFLSKLSLVSYFVVFSCRRKNAEDREVRTWVREVKTIRGAGGRGEVCCVLYFVQHLIENSDVVLCKMSTSYLEFW